MERHDLEDVLDIERTSFSTPWSKVEFEAYQACVDYRLFVAQWERSVLGYMVAQAHPEHYEIKSIAVCEGARREGVGRFMVGHLLNRIGDPTVPQACVEVIVRESRMDVIQFFSACGFMARTPILREQYRNPTEDGYVFQRKCDRVTVGTFIDDELESAE